MNRRHLKQSVVALGTLLLGVGLIFLFGLTVRATQGPSGQAGQIYPMPIVTGTVLVPAPVARSGGVPPSAEVGPEPTGSAPPSVAVRVGEHGEFERIVFEWPAAVDYDVVHRADQVIVAFDREGRFDLSPWRDGFGQRVLETRAEGGDVTRRVMLRVLPDVSIRAFGLEDNRIVVVDVLGHSTPDSRVKPGSDTEPGSIQELRRAIEQRDAAIENLLGRVKQLEEKVVLSSGDLDRVVAGGTSAEPSAQAPPSEPASEPSAPPPEPAGSSPKPASAPVSDANAKPGEFEVVEAEIDRALERTLVQTGVLLLPLGQAEIEPFFSYTRRESQAPGLFADGGTLATANQVTSRNEFVVGQSLRFGLPLDSQLELGLGYRYVDQTVMTPVGFGTSDEQDDSGYGFTDVNIGLAKTLVREDSNWWPDVVARISWDTDTGTFKSNGVVLGGGFNALRGALSVVKRQDPLAFVGGVSYEKTFEDHGITPGDELGVSIGAVLAASPGTSLRAVLAQRFIDNPKFDDDAINGSDSVVGTASVGASVVLGPGVLLDVAADIGLTDDAPDYTARASLPIRFNLPFL